MPRTPEPRSRKASRETIKTTDDAPTVLEGPKVRDFAPDDDVTDEELLDFDAVDDEPTRKGLIGDAARQSSMRLSPTLMKIFKRRREEIGLSIEQAAKLSGIEARELREFENSGGAQRLVYDHAVILSRVLGLKPYELPGLRQRDKKDELPSRLQELERAMYGAPTLVFEGKSGERFGGDVERIPTTPAFVVKIGDTTLGDGWPKGTLLGFVADAQPRIGDVVLLRHRRSRLLALRRFLPPSYVGLLPWQPSYVASSGEWIAFGRLRVQIPPT